MVLVLYIGGGFGRHSLGLILAAAAADLGVSVIKPCFFLVRYRIQPHVALWYNNFLSPSLYCLAHFFLIYIYIERERERASITPFHTQIAPFVFQTMVYSKELDAPFSSPSLPSTKKATKAPSLFLSHKLI